MDNFRNIGKLESSLLSTAMNFLRRQILGKRLRTKLGKASHNSESGFRKGRTTLDQIFCVK